MKTGIGRCIAAVTLAAVSYAPAFAGSEDVVVEGAWSRASIGTNRPGAAYMTVRNTGTDAITLTGIETDLAMRPEVHRTSTNDEGVSSMAPAGDLDIAPGAAVALEPGGLHAMLMMLQRPMVEGETFEMMLNFSDGGTVALEVPILGMAARGPES